MQFIKCRSAVMAVLVTLIVNLQAIAAEFSVEQRQELKQMIRDALVNDPEILRDAIIALQEYQEQQSQITHAQLIEQHSDALFQSQNDPWIGATNPRLSIAYFTDFNCPYCKKIEPHLERLVKEYQDVRVVFKMVPLLGPSSSEAARFMQTLWLEQPTKFLQVHEKLMSSPSRLTSASIAKVALLTGTEQYLAQSQQSSFATEVLQKNVDLMESLAIGGTPSLVFGDSLIPGLVAYEQIKQQVEHELNR